MTRSAWVLLVCIVCLAAAARAWASNGCGLEGEPCCKLDVIGSFEIGLDGCATGQDLVCESQGMSRICVSHQPAPALSGWWLGLTAFALTLGGTLIRLRRNGPN